MDKKETRYGLSSVGRAPSPEVGTTCNPVQEASVGRNEIRDQSESDLGTHPDQVATGSKYRLEEEDGKGETLGVGGSNPSGRTNLPATFTPDWLADDMVSLARIYPGMRVLEPSAGRGSIVRALHRLTAGRVTAIELNGNMIADLRDTNAHVLKQDFLKVSMDGFFDRVVMNPPKDAVPHVIKAMSCLDRGGRLVALVHADKAQALVRAFPAMRHYNLPAATFVKPDGFNQPACIVLWAKP